MFTEDEVKALRIYSGSAYRLINAYLRGEEDGDAAIRHYALSLDSAINRCPIDRRRTFYRGVDGDAAERLRGAGIAVGDRFSDAAFTSVSADPGPCKLFAAWPPGGFILSMKLEAGMRALDMSPFAEIPEEQEFLLPRGLVFKVVGEVDGPTHMLDLEIR